MSRISTQDLQVPATLTHVLSFQLLVSHTSNDRYITFWNETLDMPP